MHLLSPMRLFCPCLGVLEPGLATMVGCALCRRIAEGTCIEKGTSQGHVWWRALGLPPSLADVRDLILIEHEQARASAPQLPRSVSLPIAPQNRTAVARLVHVMARVCVHCRIRCQDAVVMRPIEQSPGGVLIFRFLPRATWTAGGQPTQSTARSRQAGFVALDELVRVGAVREGRCLQTACCDAGFWPRCHDGWAAGRRSSAPLSRMRCRLLSSLKPRALVQVSNTTVGDSVLPRSK